MFLMYFFLAFIAIGVVIGVFFIALASSHIKQLTSSIDKVSEKLADTSTDDKTGTILLPVVKMDIKAECNTVLPLPMGAEMCNHSFDVITNQIIHAPHEEKCVIILQCTKCGAMDKTIAVTSPPPPPPPPPPKLPEPPLPKSECRHNWIKEKSVTLDSAYEQMEPLLLNKKGTKQNQAAKNEDVPIFDPASAPPWMFRKQSIKERICSKCGEIDRIVTSNFDLTPEDQILE